MSSSRRRRNTYTYKSVGSTTRREREEEDAAAEKEMRESQEIRCTRTYSSSHRKNSEKKTRRFNTYVNVYWHEAKEKNVNRSLKPFLFHHKPILIADVTKDLLD